MSRVPMVKLISATPGGGATSVMDALLKTQAQGMKNEFYPKVTQSAIDYQNALTGRIPYENRLTAAQAEMQENKNPYEAAFIQSQIAGNNAQASRAPFENALNQANTDTLRAGLPFISDLNRSKIARNNAEAALKNRNLLTGATRASSPLQKSISAFQQQLITERPDLAQNPGQLVAMTDAYLKGNGTLPDGSRPPILGDTAEKLRSDVIKNLYSGKALDQMRFANTLDKVIRRSEPYIKLVSNYATPAGWLQLKLDEANALRGVVSPELNALRQLKKVFATPETAESVRLSGVNANNAQLAKYSKQFDPEDIGQNADLFLQTFENMKNIYRDIAQSVAETPGEIERNLREGPPSLSANTGNQEQHVFTEEDIKKVAKARNKTPEEVRKYILDNKGVIK